MINYKNFNSKEYKSNFVSRREREREGQMKNAILRKRIRARREKTNSNYTGSSLA